MKLKHFPPVKAFMAVAVILTLGLQLGLFFVPANDERVNDARLSAMLDFVTGSLIQQYNNETLAVRVSPPSQSTMTSKIRPVLHVQQSLWNTTTSTLPLWMKDYMEWHYHTVRILTPNTWKDNVSTRPKFLILQCMESNPKCGGLADRLKPLPLMLLGAHQTQRLLFIRWGRNRPCPLEEFMVPPPGGFDWRLPSWLDEALGDNYEGYTRRHIQNVKTFVQLTKQSKDLDIVTATIRWWDGGEQMYKNELGDDNMNSSDEFRKSYHDLFRIFFEPTPPIQALLNDIWQSTPLEPNQYAVAHYRALWWETQDPPTPQEQEETAINAIHCASLLRPGVPIYFATDSVEARRSIQRYATAIHLQNTKRPNASSIVVLARGRPLVHLDRVDLIKDNNNNILKDIYPVFVDLWLMAHGNCISFGDGGFGKYGLMLSPNYTCSFRHIYRHTIKKCEWKD